jgi:hypothetical protein
MPTATELYLRQLIGESLPPGGNEEDTFFTDEEITAMLERNNSVVQAAAAEGWAMKAADYVQFVDVEESGSVRRMSQLYRQAYQMATYYALKADAANGTSGAPRVVGRVAQILGQGDASVLVNEYIGTQTVSNVRPYPTKRMIAPLQ